MILIPNSIGNQKWQHIRKHRFTRLVLSLFSFMGLMGAGSCKTPTSHESSETNAVADKYEICTGKWLPNCKAHEDILVAVKLKNGYCFYVKDQGSISPRLLPDGSIVDRRDDRFVDTSDARFPFPIMPRSLINLQVKRPDLWVDYPKGRAQENHNVRAALDLRPFRNIIVQMMDAADITPGKPSFQVSSQFKRDWLGGPPMSLSAGISTVLINIQYFNIHHIHSKDLDLDAACPKAEKLEKP